MEASGGYERLPFALLWEAGVPCAVVNARQVRHLAQGLGLLEKTDRIDAGVIARFAAVKRLAPQPPAAAGQAQLMALVVRLRQVTDARVAQRNQGRLVTEAAVLASIEEAIAFHSRQIRELAKAIEALLDEDPLWTALADAFRSIAGVADRRLQRAGLHARDRHPLQQGGRQARRSRADRQ
jgi:transposase